MLNTLRHISDKVRLGGFQGTLSNATSMNDVGEKASLAVSNAGNGDFSLSHGVQSVCHASLSSLMHQINVAGAGGGGSKEDDGENDVREMYIV